MANSIDQGRPGTDPSGNSSGALDAVAGVPPIIASWRSYPSHIVDDSQLIGGKARGLLTLPREWVPPFLVFTRTFCSQWLEIRNAAALLLRLRTEDQSLVADFYASLLSKPGGSESRLLVRSNAASEDLSLRGAHESYTVGPNWNETAETIDRVLADAQSPGMYVLVQTGIDPSWGGHMSNERRVTDDRGKWLIEGLGERADFDQRFIGALRPETPQPLVASDKTQLVGALAMVAGELLRRKPKRFHCEWAWDGNRLWVVQCDEALEERCTESANKYLTESHAPIPSLAPISSITHFAEIDWESWTKLRCPGTFRRLGLPCADIYVLTGDKWHNADEQYRTTLLRDLTAMCVHPVVVRCDVRAGTGHDEILLPTSPATQDVDDLVAFMNQSSRDFAEKGLTASDWAFLLAHLVHAKASVMIHAQPPSPAQLRLSYCGGISGGTARSAPVFRGQSARACILCYVTHRCYCSTRCANRATRIPKGLPQAGARPHSRNYPQGRGNCARSHACTSGGHRAPVTKTHRRSI